MELREAIIHARQVAEGCASGNRDCAYQHDQLADWLEELQRYRDMEEQGRLVVLPEGLSTEQKMYESVQAAFDKHNREAVDKIAAFIEPKEGAN